MTTLSTAATFQAEPMDGWTLSNGLVALRDFLAQHLGTAGTPAEALGALGALGPGFAVLVVNTGSGTITLDPNASEQIDGAATAALGPGRAALLLCDGTAWRSLALPGTAAGQTLVGAGTAANPGLAFAGDFDTGLWRPNADAVGIAAGGAERVRVTAAGMQVTGLVTGTAVTQSVTDTTAGRLMKIGDFGLGSALSPLLPGGDFTAQLPGGMWRVSEQLTVGHPTTDAFNLGVLVARIGGVETGGGGGHCVFTFRHTSNVSNQRIRYGSRATNTGALAWVELMHNGRLLGTVSQSAGLPTGTVFERGSNANGAYVRFADGTQICTRTLTASASAAVTWTFPAAFAAAPVVNGNAVVTVLAAVCLDSAPTATSVSLSVRDKADARRADSVHLTAIGRWF
ncbi:MAG: hypothetical protein ACK4OP_13875 [Gemmobacter sp.]